MDSSWATGNSQTKLKPEAFEPWQFLCSQRQHSVLAPELWQLHGSGSWYGEGLAPLLWHLGLPVFIIIWWMLYCLCEEIRKFSFQFLHADLSCRGHQLEWPSLRGRLDRTLSSSLGRREAWGSQERHCPHPTHSVDGELCSTPLLILCFSLYLIHTFCASPFTEFIKCSSCSMKRRSNVRAHSAE